MDERSVPSTMPRQLRYRVVVDGRLDGSWAGWFDCVSFAGEGDQTAFEVEVIDQAQLQAVLRRVHDLHLRLVCVTRVGKEETSHTRGGLP